jgi:AsmA protein
VNAGLKGNMRALKIACGAIAAVTVIALLLLIAGIPFPSGFLTSGIADRLERDTGYRLTIAGSTKIGLWPSANVTMNEVRLEGPKDRDDVSRMTIGSIRANTTLASLWSGRPEITELAIDRPVLSVPLRRERQAAATPSPSKQASASSSADSSGPAIERITVTEGTVIFSNLRDHVENRIERINASAVIDTDRKIRLTGDAHAGDHSFRFDIKATAPLPPLERQNVPLELSLEAPDVLQAPLSGKAELRLNGPIIMINGLSATIGDGAFNGWASVDSSSKPLVKLDLDFRRLDIATATTSAAPQASQSASSSSQSLSQSARSRSEATINLIGLNYVDAEIRLSAAELNIGGAHLAPVAIYSTLASGILKCSFSNLGVYDGQANGEIGIDVSAATSGYTFRSDLVGVRALPLLQSAAGFDKLDGKLQAKITVRSTGQSQHAIMSNLDGTVFANFQDGTIQGLNVAQMIRTLTSTPLSGWQESRGQATDLTQLSASFRVERGQATTTDLNLVGPLLRITGAGTIDLPGKTLAFRVEPKLVMTTQGQGRAADPVGLGVPVMIQGPWTEPRISLDMAGVPGNPDQAYAKLKEIGKGLFGPGGIGGLGDSSSGGAGLSDVLGSRLGETLGKLLQQGFGQEGSQDRDQGGRSIPAPSPNQDPSSPSHPPQGDAPPQVQQESQPMKDVLRQLFNR